MATTRSIDERIREKAREQLKQEISNAFSGARRLGYGGSTIETTLKKPDGMQTKYSISYDVVDCIGAVEKALFGSMVQEAEEKAVAEFLTKIDSLQDQVDSLASDYRN